jgi:hypothetical protein
MSADPDIRLKTGQVVVDAWDLCLDSPDRRQFPHKMRPPMRRAFVHDPDDGLTVNWENDYPGGVTLNGVRSVTAHREGLRLGGPIHVDGKLEVVALPAPNRPIVIDVAAEVEKLRLELNAVKQQLADAQENWRWCENCQCLWFAGNPSSRCAAGGAHTQNRSGHYRLLHS